MGTVECTDKKAQGQNSCGGITKGGRASYSAKRG